jgi:hypothetical protein
MSVEVVKAWDQGWRASLRDRVCVAAHSADPEGRFSLPSRDVVK